MARKYLHEQHKHSKYLDEQHKINRLFDFFTFLKGNATAYKEPNAHL